MRFAYVTLGSFSGTNQCVFDRLRAEFPELEPVLFDIRAWVRASRRRTAANVLHVLGEYGPRAFADRSRLWGAFYRTQWLYGVVRREMAALDAAGPFAFTFQTQSLFDASVPGTPHYIYTDHTEAVNRRYRDFDHEGAPPAGWVERERRIFAPATAIFSMGANTANSLVEDYGIERERVHHVMAGSGIEQAELLAIEPDYANKRILFVGRDWDRKGGPELLAALAIVRTRHPGATVAIVGAEPDVTAAGVEVLGELGAEQVIEQYRRAAVYCMPSLIEPYGLAYVEALTSGLPVVANAIGAVPEIVQDGRSGYLLQPHDVEGLAGALIRLLDDPDLASRMGRAGREFVREGHTWTAAVGKMAAVIREGCASGPRRQTQIA